MTQKKFAAPKLDAKQVKMAAANRWPEILLAVCSIDNSLLDGKHHPCPKCGGTDRFRTIDKRAGALFCNQCFNKKNGDGLSTIQWLLGCDLPTAIKHVAQYLGISSNGKLHKRDLLTIVCCSKQMPVKSAKAYGAHESKRGKLKVLRFLVYNEEGEAFSYFDIPSDDGAGSKGWWKRGKGNTGIFLPDGKHPKPGDTIVVVEGVKDAAAAHGQSHFAVGLPNSDLPAKFARLFQDAHVILAPDRKTEAYERCQRNAARLHGIAASVKIAHLPLAMDGKEGDDVRDLLGKPDGARSLDQAIKDAEAWMPPGANAQSQVIVDFDERRILDEAVAALSHQSGIHQRGGLLVHIVCNADPPKGISRPADAPRIVKMPRARLRELLATCAGWFRMKGDDVDQVHPPDWVVKGVEGRGQWPGVPRIEAVAETPILRSDGTILQTSGFDPHTGVFYAPPLKFPEIAESPTRSDAERSRDELLEVVCDFPFKHLAHKATWLASCLSPFARYAYSGPTPFFLIEGNVPAVGKGLLAHCTAWICTGREFAVMAQPQNDEEARKRITSIAIAGELNVLIDNATGSLGSPSFDAALTATVWNDRILGKNEMSGPMPLYTIWYATGNNVTLVGDTARRTAHIRLESSEEAPERRSEFKHRDLLKWVRRERQRLAAAALTILRGWFVGGCPDMKLEPWGSYEGWSRVVRNAIVWTGLPDPALIRQELAEQSDDLKNTLLMLIAGWQEIDPTGEGMTVATAMKLTDEHKEKYETLQTVFYEMTPKGKSPTPQSIGSKMNALRRRVADGRYIDCHKGKNKTKVWFVQSAEQLTQGDSGD
jgi:hypothetical protein